MTHLARDKTLLSLTQGDYYNWHKSIGLVLLTLALARLIWRKTTPLPDWAPSRLGAIAGDQVAVVRDMVWKKRPKSLGVIAPIAV